MIVSYGIIFTLIEQCAGKLSTCQFSKDAIHILLQGKHTTTIYLLLSDIPLKPRRIHYDIEKTRPCPLSLGRAHPIYKHCGHYKHRSPGNSSSYTQIFKHTPSWNSSMQNSLICKYRSPANR